MDQLKEYPRNNVPEDKLADLCPSRKHFPIVVNNRRDNQDSPPLSGGDTFGERRVIYLIPLYTVKKVKC